MSDIPRYREPGWAAAHALQLDTSRMEAERLGQGGVSAAEIQAVAEQAESVHASLRARRARGELPFYDLPGQNVTSLLELADSVRERFRNFLLIGIGGSSLGPKATHQALRSAHYNLEADTARGGPRIFFMENVDPHSVRAILALLDPAETCANVVTKSGGTAETLANYMVVRAWLERSVKNPAEHLIATTDPERGDLRGLVRAEGWRSLDVPPAVGGRFSQLTPVGLFPAAVCGIDIRELLAGAGAMAEQVASCDLEANPAYRIAALHYLADTAHGKPVAVMMPYADGLERFADWFVQLWAESLGKAEALDGHRVNVGQTPLGAVGAIDQHSQVQLFVEGPKDKMVTFLRVERFDDPVPIPKSYGDVPSMGYLGGASLEALLNAEQAATEAALTEQGRPNMRITLPALNAYTLGQLFYLYEVATAFAGGLYGINPFDQPGVERGKQLTYGAMGRKGYPNLIA